MTPKEKVEYYSFLHKQNLNGRETEDELFEAGILVGIEETEIIADEFAIGFAEWAYRNEYNIGFYFNSSNTKELLEIYKKTL
jgi:hypothetical protein